MRKKIIKFLFSAVLLVSYCNAEITDGDQKSANVNNRDGRSITNDYLDIFKCAGQFNLACVLDKSENVLVDQHQRFMVQADQQALMSGRKQDKDETPSALIETISNLLSELSEMFFKSGITGMFRDGKEEESETEVQKEDGEEEDDDKIAKARGINGVARKKKKKEKLRTIIKLIVLGVVLFGKITLLLKVLAAHLQIKFLIIAAAGLILNAARFYLDLKKGHQPQKVIYYEHAQHQHHYEGGEEDWSGGGGSGGHGGGYWARSYEQQDDKNAQDLAYAQQKPTGTAYTRVKDTPNYSWL